MKAHSLRSMNETDLEQVLRWRNHPRVRRYMYSNHKIGMEEHRAWFANASRDPAMYLLIYLHDDQPAGYLNITRTRSFVVADWGFYVSPEASRGVGRSLGAHALAYAFNDLGLHKLCGQALAFNERSIAFHKALGFTEEGCLREQHRNESGYHDVVCFGLLSREWQQAGGEAVYE